MTVIEWIADHVDLAGFVTFLAGAVALALLQWLARALVKARYHLGKRNEWYGRLERLRTDVALGYFEQELGLSHAFRNAVADGYVEYIYPHKWFFVQAVTNADDQIVMYSVTARSGDFAPRVWPTSTSPRSRPAIPNPRLGSVSFAEMFRGQTPDGIRAFFSGATAPSFYMESYSIGTPGYYLTYLIGLNDAGHYFFEISDAYSEELLAPEVNLGRLAARYDNESDIADYLLQEHVGRFRSLAKPNAYGIIGQLFPATEPLRVYLGPDRTQVRTL